MTPPTESTAFSKRPVSDHVLINLRKIIRAIDSALQRQVSIMDAGGGSFPGNRSDGRAGGRLRR